MPGLEWTLDCCVVIGNLWPACHEVPTEREVVAIPESEHLRKDFPPTPETWPPLLLVGRAYVWAMGFRYQSNPGKSGHPMAAKTNLGWALIGPTVTSVFEKNCHQGRRTRRVNPVTGKSY